MHARSDVVIRQHDMMTY